MQNHLITRLLLTLTLLLGISTTALAGADSTPVHYTDNLMPRPQQISVTGGTYTGTIADAQTVFVSANTLAALGAYDYNVAGFDNEGYQLSVTTTGITIKAVTELGVIRAKQTLAQLEHDGTFECCEILDWPAFKVRGFMHDVGRSYISFAELKKEIDLLSRFKVNVFHWHMSDYHAFRFESKLHPEVNQKAFERFVGKYYTQDECRELDAYAAERGVTIIPEIDMPGHSRQFKNATGYDMNSTQGKAILKDILGELVECFPHAPYVHVGADETSVTQAYVKEMTDFIHDKDKKTVCWQTYGGGTVAPTAMGIDMLTNWATSGKMVSGVPNIDMRYFYVNHFDVFADLEGAYRSLIFDAERGNSNIGGVSIGIWNDRYLGDERQIIAQNNVYAAVLAMTERAWCGGTYQGHRHQYIETGGAYLPNEGWEYDEFADWERRFLYYKSTWLKDEPIPYVKQTNIRWNITPAYDNGGDTGAAFAPETPGLELTPQPGSIYATGAGQWLNHIWNPTVKGVLGSQGYNQTRYAWTYVYSPKDQTVGAQIEFRNYSRSDAGLVPQNGKWDILGSRVWVNDSELLPSWEWTNAGVNPNIEKELGNLNFPGREPLKVQLHEGWNKVLLKLPYVNIGGGNGNRPNKWQYTFVLTDTEGKNAVDGLVYSPSKNLNGPEDFTVPSAPRIAPTASTDGDTHWYTIKSLRDNRLVTNSDNMVSATTAADNTYWKFIDRGDHTYDIISYTDGRYISPVANNNTAITCTASRPSTGWSLGPAQTDGYFIIYSGTTQLNQTKSSQQFQLYNWGYGQLAGSDYHTNDQGCQFIFTEVEQSDVYYSITNHQYDGKTHVFYVDGNQLKIGEANVAASAYGDKALFVKEAKGSKWAFRNKASGEYLVFCGLSYGTNSDKGVVSTYNSTYCDFTLTPNSRVDGGLLFTGKRDNGKNGTFVVKKGGDFDAWSDATECWRTDFSNVFTLDEVSVSATAIDAFFTTEAQAQAGQYRWVRLSNVRDAYSIHAGTDVALHSHPTDFTSENELFALVGTEQSFKLYSRTARQFFGYSAASSGSAVTKGATTQTFRLINNKTNTKPGYNIVPTGNTGQSLNMHGGKGQDIKFYDSTDGGSTWKLALADKEVQGGIRLVGTPSATSGRYLGKVSTTVGGSSGETLVTLDNVTTGGSVTYYVGEGDHLAVTPSVTFRGYTVSVDGMKVTYTIDTANKAQYLFNSTGAEHPYRIPAITRTRSGRLIALSDYRTCGNDIGYGRVDIVGRISDDNGSTWSAERMVLEGDGINTSPTCGYGDAALVADYESDDVMLMCVSAPKNGTCWTSAQRGVISISHDEGLTWDKPIDIKDKICNTGTSLIPGAINYFVGSGKLHQSRYIKVGSHYRVYAALWTTPNGSAINNYVVYTDDFGKTWKLLGSASTPCVPGGNEPKCEELPDGSVIISSRRGSGRYYNVFTYAKTDNADFSRGSWGTSVTGCTSGDSGTDGEIVITKAVKPDGQLVTIALQSMPNSGRNNVSIWYKELNDQPGHTFTPSEFQGNWTKGLEVSHTSSAYSTMCLQDDGRLAFYFEEGPAGYEMVYLPLTIAEATGGAYNPAPWSVAHVAKAADKAVKGTSTLREIREIGRYILHPFK